MTKAVPPVPAAPRTQSAPAAEPASPFGPDVVAKAQDLAGRYPVARSALLPMLHLVQSVQGYVSAEGIAFCAEQLGLTPADVSAVATFYTMYKRKPCGEHLVSVCTNTLCAALGGDAIYTELTEHLGVGHNETAGAPDNPGSVTLEHAECLAACDLAPVLQVNYEFFDKQTPESAVDLVAALQRGERPHPTRGAPLTSFRDVELQIAGFFDRDGVSFDDEVAGDSAAEETLRGAQLATERGWNAPPMPDDAPLPPAPEKKA